METTVGRAAEVVDTEDENGSRDDVASVLRAERETPDNAPTGAAGIGLRGAGAKGKSSVVDGKPKKEEAE